MKPEQMVFIVRKLRDMHHTELWIGYELGVLTTSMSSVKLHDDVYKVISSEEYLNLLTNN